MSKGDTFIDLHIHTSSSDGSMSPSELVQHAKQNGLSAIAITDHDSIGGIDEALEAGGNLGIRVIPGIELACNYNGVELHMLGYFINHRDELLNQTLRAIVETRKRRNVKMLEKLGEMGIEIDESELSGDDTRTLTRVHIASKLVEKGYTESIPEAFRKYVGREAPAYVVREKLSPEQCISLIHRAGGLAFLAHLNQAGLDDRDLLRLLSDLKEMGLDGIEGYYPDYSPEMEKTYLEFASIYDLLVSGGSDFHGANRPNRIGVVTGGGRLTSKVLEEIDDARRRISAQ